MVYCREDSSHRHLFTRYLVDDKSESTMSYVEFLRYIREQIVKWKMFFSSLSLFFYACVCVFVCYLWTILMLHWSLPCSRSSYVSLLYATSYPWISIKQRNNVSFLAFLRFLFCLHVFPFRMGEELFKEMNIVAFCSLFLSLLRFCFTHLVDGWMHWFRFFSTSVVI